MTGQSTAHRHGISRKRTRSPEGLKDLGPRVGAFGFCVIGALALAVVAATVLVPAYASLLAVRYERESLAARNADMAAHLVAGQRMVEAAQQDTTFIQRLALSQGEFVPANRRVLAGSGDGQLATPDVVAPTPTLRPAAPPRWLTTAAFRLSRPATRRGLLLLSAGLMLTAAVTFAPASTRKNAPSSV
ncbi:hypothetical protein LCGC14_0471240 [marine sediment metagenome]|uniref:Uncharacterized protein n=1 Tax=marine sediment metagenome TaxID=412755 RepID=A0A0F9UZ13_9ZZZZ